MEIIFDKEAINNAVDAILDHKNRDVIRIDGTMGAGKTTLISALCKRMGVTETTSSPTFSLVNTYKSPQGAIYHFDFYRLENSNEAIDFGVEEYFESGNICLLEWAEIISEHLPLSYDHYQLEMINASTRKLKQVIK
jgi:tRNA threonylcarbamoyladenosine biosynthesis protein TsaE